MKKLMVIIAAMAMLSTSAAFAADWNFYGSARITTFYSKVDFDTPGVDDTTNLNHSLQGNARIGANVKVSDELTGRFEYGTGGGNANIRILYGEWNFGAGKMLVGKTYSPLNMFYSNQVYGSDNDLLNYGGVYAGRQAMVQFRFGDFKIALVEPTTAAVGAFAVDEVVIPKLEASYRLNMDNWHLAFQGGYNTYEVSNGITTLDVDSYIGAIGGGFDFGAFYVNANYWLGQNAGSYGLYNAPADDPLVNAAGNGLNDSDGDGYLLVAGWKLNDMWAFEAGYASAKAENDNVDNEDKVKSYYIQSTINFAPGVFIVPEIGVIDNEEAGTDKTTYYGLKWQINF